MDIAPDGSAFIDEKSEIKILTDSIFAAAFDAADKKKWPDEARPEYRSKGVFKTQKRHINGLLLLLGIAAESCDKQRENVTANLGLTSSELHRGHARIRDGPRLLWREKGLQIKELLTPLQPLSRHLASIQTLGFKVEFWGQPIDRR